jgi:YidC/Oxa1 family membrane protein insertase
MDKRFLLTIVLCFAISVIYMDWITPPREPQPPGPTGVIPGVFPQGQPADGQPDVARGVGVLVGTDPVVDTVPVVQEQLFSLRNSVLEVEISNRGASLVRATLPAYQEEVQDHEALDLISPELESGSALLVKLPSSGVDLVSRIWEVEKSSFSSVSFRTDLGSGRWVVRQYYLPEDSYELMVSILFDGVWPVATDVHYEFLGAKRIRFDESGRATAFPNQWITAYHLGDGLIGDLDRSDVEAIETGEIRREGVAWGALESNYFAQVIRPLPSANGKSPSLGLLALGARPGEREAEFSALEDAGLQGWPLRVGFRRKVEARIPHEYAVFLGPKDPGVLGKHASWDAIRLIDYGFFGWLVRPFLWLLRLFDGFFGSWGIAIVLLTFCIRGLLHPVNKKNQRQMQIQQQGMARLKPQMEEIKERYKNDPPAQHRKMQELFKSEGVNPAAMFGGCLFIFLQLPIWLALINTFTIAIELRQTSFLWVDDLTRPDMLFHMPFSLPLLGDWFNLLPILYVIISIVNQRMMPRSDDPQVQMQQKMMTFMLIAFGFIFYTFASGLMVYFITSAMVGIAEQKMIRRDLRAAGIMPTPAGKKDAGISKKDTGPAGPGSSGSGSSGPARPGQGKVRSR